VLELENQVKQKDEEISKHHNVQKEVQQVCGIA